jgi:RNA polymerase sigma factor (sigma-70 family)
MTLTQAQQRKVEQNLGLVGKVIKDKVHDPGQNSIYNYDDLYQIGCIGLCKAAYSDKGGCFSTYAYRLIWNEICTALIYANRRAAKECELIPDMYGQVEYTDAYSELNLILNRLEADSSDAMAKGIRAIRLSAEGYSCAEIGSILGESEKCVAARISRTRKYLRSHAALAAF